LHDSKANAKIQSGVRAFSALCNEPDRDTSFSPQALDLLNKLASFHCAWDSTSTEEQPEIRLWPLGKGRLASPPRRQITSGDSSPASSPLVLSPLTSLTSSFHQRPQQVSP